MIYLGLGSNVGDKLGYLKSAVSELGKIGEIKNVSSVYETEPWGNEDQDTFLNACVAFESNLDPEELLYKVKQIEEKLGRKDREHWGPREIDIDILFYDDLQLVGQRLTIPHPLLHERAFVLAPLAEIALGFVHPGQKNTVEEMFKNIDNSGITKLVNKNLTTD